MRGYEYIPKEVKEFVAVPTSASAKAGMKNQAEKDKESSGANESSSSATSYLSLPSFFSSESKTDSTDVPAAKVDEHGMYSFTTAHSMCRTHTLTRPLIPPLICSLIPL